MCENERICADLMAYISEKQNDQKQKNSKNKLLLANTKEYFVWKTQISKVAKRQNEKQGSLVNLTYILDGKGTDKNQVNQAKMPPRRRVRGGGVSGTSQRPVSENLPPALDLNEEPEIALDLNEENVINEKSEANAEYIIKGEQGVSIAIRAYNNFSDRLVLQTMQPEYVIMYDANPSFIRQVEVKIALLKADSPSSYSRDNRETVLYDFC